MERLFTAISARLRCVVTSPPNIVSSGALPRPASNVISPSAPSPSRSITALAPATVLTTSDGWTRARKLRLAAWQR
jgi:hypothetical protein